MWIIPSPLSFRIRVSLLLRLSSRFELPIDGVVHHLFESSSLFPLDQFRDSLLASLRRVRSEIEQSALSLSEDRWNRIESRCLDLMHRSFAWYSGHASAAVILSKADEAFGGCVESSAYNPTINPLQVMEERWLRDRWHSSIVS